jgi:nucleotide-binding universal stress UspA family protein
VAGVVVGVDDSHSARAAVAWAAAAAARRGVGLHLVEVLPASGGSGTEDGTPHGRARALLFRAQGIARAISPSLSVSMQTLSGRVGPALVGYAAEASLLVVGSNGPGGPIPLSLGSIIGEVTTRCECPVVLVPAAAGTRSREWEGPVLVALDGAPDDERAVEFAAAAAHRRGEALVILAGAQGSGHPDPAVQPAPGAAALGRVRERFPGLAVHTQTVTGRPDDALLGADAGAQLIVVASRRRSHGLAGALTGWTRRFLPVLSTCPVAMVSTRTRPAATLG